MTPVNLHARLPSSLRLCAATLLLALLAACGFRMQGATPLPFDSLYLDIPAESRFGTDIRRSLYAASPHTVDAAHPGDAQARLHNLGLTRSQRELSLNPQGQVEEYELTLTFRFRLTDRDGNVLIPDTTLSTTRDLPYDAQLVQAKESEMETLYQDMQRSLVARVVRRLTAPDVHATVARLAQERAADNTRDGARP